MKYFVYTIKKINILIISIFGYLLNKITLRNQGKKSDKNIVLIVCVHHLGEGILFFDCLRHIYNKAKNEKINIHMLTTKVNCEFMDHYIGIEGIKYVNLDSIYGLSDEKLSILGYFKLLNSYKSYNIASIVVPFESLLGDFLLCAMRSDRKFLLHRSSLEKEEGIFFKIARKISAVQIIEWKKEDMILRAYKDLYAAWSFGDLYPVRIGNINIEKKSCKSDDFRYCVITPGAREIERRWESKKFLEVIKFILDNSELHVYICGSKEDSIDISSVDNVYKSRIVDLTGQTSIDELMQIIANARFIFGNDSGPIHMAAALGVGACCLAFYKDFKKYQPYEIELEEAWTQKPLVVYGKGIPSCAGCERTTIKSKYFMKWDNLNCRNRIFKGQNYMCVHNIEVSDVKLVLLPLL